MLEGNMKYILVVFKNVEENKKQTNQKASLYTDLNVS